MNTKHVAIVAVIIIIVIAIAAVAVVMSGNDDDDKKDLPEFASGTGTIYGNADGNTYIDQTDIDLIQAIINGDRSFSDFPLADANNDGKVDADDIEIVKKFINGEKVTMKVLDTQDNVVDVVCPIDKVIILCGSNLAPLITVLGCTDKVIAAAYSTLNDVRDYSISQGINNGTITKLTTKGTTADVDTISKLVKDTGVHTMFTEYSSMYDLDDEDHVKTYNDWGIDVLELECRNPGQDTRSLAVFGILLGCGDKAAQYTQFVDDIYEQIKEKEGSAFGTKTFMATASYGGFANKESGYVAMGELAGGVNLSDWSKSSKSVPIGSTWIYEEKYNSAQYLVFGGTSYYGKGGFNTWTAAQVGNYSERYSNMDAWKNNQAYILSTSMPVVCRVAAFAEILYPEIFESGWADSVHQSFIDTFYDTSYTVEHNYFFMNISTYTPSS